MDPAADTKTRLLDAAERLFADHGFTDASLRAITAQAGANLAAVNYHFGGKEGLFEAVLARMLQPMNAERLRRLDRLEAGGEPIALEALIEAFVGPPFELKRDHGERGAAFMRLMGHASSDPTEHVRELVIRQFRGVFERFLPAFAKLLPGLSQGELIWRIFFTVGSMLHTMAMADDLERVAGPALRMGDGRRAMARLVTFAAAGLRADAGAA